MKRNKDDKRNFWNKGKKEGEKAWERKRNEWLALQEREEASKWEGMDTNRIKEEREEK